ncbi:MAG: DUF4276 family protein [Clostridiales bacterium]|nr:DUF4276 family protein [Clostridiales bacterium]
MFIEKLAINTKLNITETTTAELKHKVIVSNKTAARRKTTFVDRLYKFAVKNKYKHIAYHMDADHDYDKRYSELKEQFTNEMQEICHCLVIVPKEMIESWLLSDMDAFSPPINQKILPKKPEEIWGEENDPESNHPKNYLKRVLYSIGKQPNRDTYAEIAQNISIDVILKRCPKSFGRFYADMQEFIKERT